MLPPLGSCLWGQRETAPRAGLQGQCQLHLCHPCPGKGQRAPTWEVQFPQAQQKRWQEVRSESLQKKWILALFWRNAISRMRLTDWQGFMCWEVPG